MEATVEIQIRNGSSEPATVHRDRFRLVAPDGVALPAVTWRAIDPLTVAGGAAQTFALRFMTRGGLACAKQMRLDAAAGITLGGRPVALQPVAFVPNRDL